MLPTIDPDHLLDTFLALLRAPSFHPHEQPVIDLVVPRLERLGLQVTIDEARNVLGYWPALLDKPTVPPAAGDDQSPIMLNAHMDTVRPTDGLEPIVERDRVRSNGASVLGADDKCAVAAILESLEAVAQAGMPHSPVEVLFTVGEEVGHVGAKAFDVRRARSGMAFVLDAGGRVGDIITAAPWSRQFRAAFEGRAAHAGIEPENGRSALVMAARAVTAMRLGRLDGETTANAGTLTAGEATNIVPPRAELRAETRSLDPAKLQRQLDAMLAACRRAADECAGRVEIDVYGRYEGYRFESESPVIRRAAAAVRDAGLEPRLTTTGGGSDANEFNAQGLPAVVLSVGYRDIHTNEEWMPLDELNRLARVCAALVAVPHD